MSTKDSLGRRRSPGQTRGLRPLYPPLPAGMRSRSVRVAMSDDAWGRLDRYASEAADPTGPRAVGRLIEHALAEAERHRVADWLQWQIRKEQRLLEAS